MVQEKDAAIKRVERRKEFQKETERRMEQNTLDWRYYVIEHTPGYNTGGYYDTDVPAKNIVVSPYFKKKPQAQAWMDAHEPDKGKTLHVKADRLMLRQYKEWVRAWR